MPRARREHAGGAAVLDWETHMKDFADRGSRRRGRRARGEGENSSSFFESHGRGRRDHKTAQLCRQVFRAVSLALAECGDDVLRELVVHEVEPAPDASRLLVRVGFSASVADVSGVADVLGRLAQASGFLRREVASAITRKRAPELMFTFAAADAGGEVMR
jgi:ribosome-binding factor A